MKKTTFILLSCLLCLLSVGKATSQELLWGADFDFFFDNREYKSKLTMPQTQFGARLAPEIGIGWGRHSLMAGISVTAEFGAKPFERRPDLIFYYGYKAKKFKGYFGAIPRSKIMGDYSKAFFSDSIEHYDPTIEGVLLQYVGGKGYVEFGCDWNSRLSKTKREKFMLFSNAQLRFGVFNMGYQFSMYHHAGYSDRGGVVDNVWIYPFVGLDMSSKIRFLDSLTLRAGWINTFQNDRTYVGEYVKPGGAQIELRIEKYHFGIYNTLYLGKNLMPYYEGCVGWENMTPEEVADLDYGPGLYWGDPYYRTSDVYNRLEIYWQPINNGKVNIKVASVHHYDGTRWDWQQMLTVGVRINQGMFKKRLK